jgi:hypothetical protein
MTGKIAALVPLEIGAGIGLCACHPVEVHLHADQMRIGVGQDQIIGHIIAQPGEFTLMVVEGKGQTGARAGLTGLVEDAQIAVEHRARFSWALNRIGQTHNAGPATWPWR